MSESELSVKNNQENQNPTSLPPGFPVGLSKDRYQFCQGNGGSQRIAKRLALQQGEHRTVKQVIIPHDGTLVYTWIFLALPGGIIAFGDDFLQQSRDRVPDLLAAKETVSRVVGLRSFARVHVS